MEIGKNVDATVSGNTLTIIIDLSKDYGASKTGKSIIIASSEGNAAVPGNEAIKFGLNVFKANKP